MTTTHSSSSDTQQKQNVKNKTHVSGTIQLAPDDQLFTQIFATACFVRSKDSLKAGKVYLEHEQQKLSTLVSKHLEASNLRVSTLKAVRAPSELDNFEPWDEPEAKFLMISVLSSVLIFHAEYDMSPEELRDTFDTFSTAMLNNRFHVSGSVDLQIIDGTDTDEELMLNFSVS